MQSKFLYNGKLFAISKTGNLRFYWPCVLSIITFRLNRSILVFETFGLKNHPENHRNRQSKTH